MSAEPTQKESFTKLPRLLISIISLIGLGIMAYLTYQHFTEAAKSVCDLNETVSCSAVTASIYSEIFGFPISMLGLGYFGLVFLLSIFQRNKNFYQLLFYLTVFVLIPSYYFTALEIFVIKAICIFCETSKILMILTMVISFLAMKEKLGTAVRMAIPIIIAGFVAAGVTYFAQTSVVAKKDYTPFVMALNEKGVVYYKSYTCSNCKKQEQIIGKEAIAKLNSVECHPKGPDGNPELCLEKDIEHTPTFILEKDGVDVKRHEGVFNKLEDLAKWAGIPVEKLEE